MFAQLESEENNMDHKPKLNLPTADQALHHNFITTVHEINWTTYLPAKDGINLFISTNGLETFEIISNTNITQPMTRHVIIKFLSKEDAFNVIIGKTEFQTVNFQELQLIINNVHHIKDIDIDYNDLPTEDDENLRKIVCTCAMITEQNNGGLQLTPFNFYQNTKEKNLAFILIELQMEQYLRIFDSINLFMACQHLSDLKLNFRKLLNVWVSQNNTRPLKVLELILHQDRLNIFASETFLYAMNHDSDEIVFKIMQNVFEYFGPQLSKVKLSVIEWPPQCKTTANKIECFEKLQTIINVNCTQVVMFISAYMGEFSVISRMNANEFDIKLYFALFMKHGVYQPTQNELIPNRHQSNLSDLIPYSLIRIACQPALSDDFAELWPFKPRIIYTVFDIYSTHDT